MSNEIFAKVLDKQLILPIIVDVETLSAWLPYIQIGLAVLLTTGILLQRSDSALGGVFGGGSDSGTKFTRRGLENTLFQATIVLAILFAGAAILNVLV